MGYEGTLKGLVVGNNFQMESLIERAMQEVAQKGWDASDRAVLLAGLAWVKGSSRGNRKEIVLRLGTPMALGGGFVGIVISILDRVL